MEQFRYIDNSLFCEEADLKSVAEEFGTPLYVYSRQSVIDHCRWIEEAFGPAGHLSCYAIKANANPAILRILAGQGIGADAGSLGELQLALAAGFSPEKVTFSGVGKGDEEIEFALLRNIHSLNAESEEEIQVISGIAARLNVRARILLRVNFDIPSETHPYTTTGRKHNKFGVVRSSALPVLRRALSLPNVDVLGVHSHIGSQITKPGTFVAAAGAVAELVRELRAAGLSLTHLNFGGGFGVQYRDYVRHPHIPSEQENPEADMTTVAMLRTVLPILEPLRCRILIQPGRSIVAHAGILLTKVLYRKTDRRTFIVVDAGMNDLIRPSLYQSYHQIVPLRVSAGAPETADVVGPLCESGDFFALDRVMPRVGRGDYLGVLCAGAYGYVLASNYNGRPRPAEVLVDGKRCSVIRGRETFAAAGDNSHHE